MTTRFAAALTPAGTRRSPLTPVLMIIASMRGTRLTSSLECYRLLSLNCSDTTRLRLDHLRTISLLVIKECVRSLGNRQV